MATEKDLEQDALIRQNADHIRRNEEAIRRQTECLEKIRDHYFPRKTVWKSTCGLVLKVIGAITVYTGLMEGVEWYVNARAIEGMAKQSVTVARRLMFEESDMEGAVAFLTRAVELEGNSAKYRTMLAYVKGMRAISDLFDIARPLTADERERVDAILAEAVFLQTAAPEDPMPHVLTAQAYVLRREFALAEKAVAKAVSLDPGNVQVRCSGCAIRFFAHDLAKARAEIEEAANIQPNFPLVLYWKGMLSAVADRDFAKAREWFSEMSRVSPRLALSHAMLGWALLNGLNPDVAAARAELVQAVEICPGMKRALLAMGESYADENPIVARLWYGRALACDGNFMAARLARARVSGKLGDWEGKVDDLSAAIALDPFRADLLRERASALDAWGKTEAANADRAAAEAIDRSAPTA